MSFSNCRMESTLGDRSSSISALDGSLVLADSQSETSIPFREKDKPAHSYIHRTVGNLQFGYRRSALRVKDFSISGALLVTEETIPVGTRLDLLFSVPEGEIRLLAVVRSSISGRGIGVEFVGMESGAFDSILKLVKRLLE